MNQSTLAWTVAAAALALGACDSAVISNTEGTGGAGSGVDPECYDACIAKGEKPEICTDWCGTKGTGGKGSSSSSSTSTSSTSSSGTSTSSSSSTSGKPDPDIEKPCIECWYGEPACADAAAACDASLACQQLQWCPTLCGKPDCIYECNDIIPTGVEPLTALVECAVCNGGPCWDECQGSVMLAYCQ